MSKLTAMLKWAMRIVAVGGAMLAMAVGTAAWMHRTDSREWCFVAPAACSGIIISPQYVVAAGWRRREWDPGRSWNLGRYGVASKLWDNPETESVFRMDMRGASFGREWHGFGIVQGWPGIPSGTEALCPTWAAITALLLPTGLWAGIGWRQRRRVKAGHCANCGYDLRATPEKCPECGRAVRRNAEG